jgi:hypothetical protein
MLLKRKLSNGETNYNNNQVTRQLMVSMAVLDEIQQTKEFYIND